MNIVLTGSLAVDQIMNFDGLFEEMIKPEKIHVLSISVLLKKLQKTRGGTAGNIAYSLALLGEKPILYASIGQDQKEYMMELSRLGVDTTQVHYSSLPSASFSVFTDRNDCQIGGFYPGAMNDASSLRFEKFFAAKKSMADTKNTLFVISAHDPAQMEVQIDECLEGQYRMCFDVGQQVIALSPEVLKKGLAAVEVLIVNDYELEMLAQRTGLTTQQVIHQVPVCLVTLGEKGSQIFLEKQDWKAISVPAVHVDTVLDPTGAGDAFRSGFFYGYVREWSVVDAVQLGSTVAAYVVEQYGTQVHSFTKKELQKRYFNLYGHQLDLHNNRK